MNFTDTEQQLAYTRALAAAATGLPPVTIDGAIKRGELKAIRSGRRIVILREDLIAWLGRCRERGVIPPRVTQADRERFVELNRRRTAAEV